MVERVAPRGDMEFKGLADAVRQSLEYYKNLPPEIPFSFGPDRVTALDMAATLQDFLRIIEDDSIAYDEKLRQIKKIRSISLCRSERQRQGAVHRVLRADIDVPDGGG